MRELLFFSIGALIGSLLIPVLLEWLARYAVRCDGGEGKTPLFTERDEYE